MDKKEIDRIMEDGSLDDFNRRQEMLVDQLQELKAEGKASAKGRVIGQLSNVTEDSELGTNMVMNYLENIMTITAKFKTFLDEFVMKKNDDPATADVDEIVSYSQDTLFLIEDLLFNAMDAFQFQDINRQKLMKVMYTLGKLNKYLNDLLGSDENKRGTFGRQIENKNLFKDMEKKEIDELVAEYKSGS